MTSIVAPLAITAVYANKDVTTHDTKLTVMLPLECCQKTFKKKHVRFVSLTFNTFVAIDMKGGNGEVASVTVCCLPSVVRRVQRSLYSLIFVFTMENYLSLCHSEICAVDDFDFSFICGLAVRYFLSRGGSRGRVQGVRTPPPTPEMTCGFLINTVQSASQLYKICFII